MRRRFLFLVAAAVPIAALLGLMAWGIAQSGGRPGGPLINKVFGEVTVKEAPAPFMRLTLLQGGTLDLADLRGKLVMVDFWSSWCPPCVQEAPALAAVYPQYAGRGVEFVGVAIWDDEAAVRRHVQRFGVPYPNGLDVQGKIAIDYGVRGIPEKFFIDPQGRLVRKFVGPVTPERLRAVLEELLAPGRGG